MKWIKNTIDKPSTDKIYLLRIIVDDNKILYTTGTYNKPLDRFLYQGLNNSYKITHYLPIIDVIDEN